MSRVTIRLPDSLHAHIRKLAERENISINQLVTLAVAEKVAALDTAEYLAQRASRADKKQFLKAMNKVSDIEPGDNDIL